MTKPFKQGTALLVTSQITQRSGLRKVLMDVGIENKLIDVAADYQQAMDRLAKTPVTLLITDDNIGNDHKGMELLELHIKNNPSSKERLFVIMVSESSPFFLADFALKGGDVIMNKPFTNETFINNLTTAIAAKEKLTTDECLAFDIQDAIKIAEIDKASGLLEKFKDKELIHALYSKAAVYEAKQENELAYETYLKVVNLNPDFKSLVSLVRIGKQLQKHFELIDLIEIWVSMFPLHHDSIQDITRVIIANKKFDLLDEIFDLFAKHKINDTFAKVPLAAGFVMASAYHFENKDNEKAKTYALKAIEYSCRKMQILYKAADMLMKLGAKADAEKAYERLSLPTGTTEEKVADIKMKSIIYPKNKVLAECTKLLSQKVVDADLYMVTISCLREIGKDPGDIISQAKRAFPSLSFE